MELEEVWSQYQEVQKEKYHVKRDKLQKSQQALDAVGKEQITLYERYGKREIQREEYIEFREELQKKEDFIKSEIQEQEMRLAEVETEFHAELPDAHIIWKECKINELNQEVVDKSTEKWLQEIYDNLEFSEWYAGHYHVESEENGIRIMFEDYDEICEEE